MFAVFVLTSEDHVLNANIAFVTVSYINTLQMSLSILPLCVTFAGQVRHVSYLSRRQSAPVIMQYLSAFHGAALYYVLS